MSAAGVQVHDDFLRALSLMHVRAPPTSRFARRASKSATAKGVDHGFHRLLDDMLFPVAGVGVGRRLVPRDAVRAALEFRRGEEVVRGRGGPRSSLTLDVQCQELTQPPEVA